MIMQYVAYGILGVVALLALTGVLNRVFDRMSLPAGVVFLTAAAIIGFSLIPAIKIGGVFSFNIGGFIIPLIICAVLLFKIGFTRGLLHTLLGIAGVTASVFLLRYFLPLNTLALQITSSIIIGFIAGSVAYLLGRNRRGAFVSAVLGIYLAEIIVFLADWGRGLDVSLALGLGSMLASLVIAAVTALTLAETVRFIRERSMNDSTRGQVRERYDSGAAYNVESGEFHDYHDLFESGEDD